MVAGKKWILIPLAVVLIAGLWLMLRPTDERIIRRQFSDIEKLFKKGPDEPPLKSLKKAAGIGAYIADPCRLTLEKTNSEAAYTHKEATDRVILLRSRYTTLDMEIHDLEITLDSDRQAQAVMTVRIIGEAQGLDLADVQEVRAVLEKQEGKWLIAGVTVIEVLTGVAN